MTDEKTILLEQAQSLKRRYYQMMERAKELAAEVKAAKDEAKDALSHHLAVMNQIETQFPAEEK